jgi:hypothetical protein
MTLTTIADEMYTDQPQEVLYHYTSLKALLEIVESGCLFATDISFFSDAAEMKHTANLFRIYISQRIESGAGNSKLLLQLREWVSERLTRGHSQFVVSFTKNGNLLSQWRSYCPHGKGVSIGFSPNVILHCASSMAFRVGRCIYDNTRQKEIIEEIISQIEELGAKRDENLDASKRHPSQSFHDIFVEIEDDLLRVAALMKHGKFSEEQEWRVVSPVTKNYVLAPIKYREGRSMLIPYMDFRLRNTSNDPFPLDSAFLGPTPSVNNSMSSLSQYLSKYKANPRNGVHYCDIPYREH